MRERYPAITLTMMMSALSIPPAVVGGVATDGSMGPAMELAGPDFTVDESLGTRAGTNLFHSFDHFGIATGESATFTGSAGITNVVSRVTGGEVSSIDGTLRSEIGTAAFWFFNPAGVLFGPNAWLDLPAALHVATGDLLRFADGSTLSADPTRVSTLSLSPPESFGFLGDNRATIGVQGGMLGLTGDTLSLDAHTIEIDSALVQNVGGTIRMSADGAIVVQDSTIETGGEQAGGISLQAGQITLGNSAVGDYNHGTEGAGGAVTLRGGELLLSHSLVESVASSAGDGSQLQLESSGDLTIADGSRVEVSGLAGGAVGRLEIRAGNLYLTDYGSGIGSYRDTGDGQAEGVNIEVAGQLSLGGGTEIVSDTYGDGKAGDLRVSAGALSIGEPDGERAWITSDAMAGSGDAGAVTIDVVGGMQIRNGSFISSDVYSAGNGGSVEVRAGDLEIDGRGFDGDTGISSDARQGSGSAGSVLVEVDGKMVLRGGVISSDTATDGTAGAMLVTAGELTMESGANISSDTYAGGDAGALLVTADTLRMDGADGLVEISSDSKEGASGAAGGVLVQVTGEMVLQQGAVASDTYTDAPAGVIWIEAERLVIRGGAQSAYVSSDTMGGAGEAGRLGVVARELVIENNGYISSDTYGSGDAGIIYIETESLQMDGAGSYAQISSDAIEGSSGAAGKVALLISGHGELLDGAYISSDTYGSGNAGGVDLIAGSLTLDGAGYEAAISSGTYGGKDGVAGTGGLVRLVVNGDLQLRPGGWVDSSTEGGGDAGDIQITADRLWIEGGAAGAGIASESVAGGTAGQIELAIPSGIILYDNAQISTTTDGGGDAGGIWIGSDSLWIEGGSDDSQITSQSTNGGGKGGQIELVLSGRLVLFQGAEISSSIDGDQPGGRILIAANAIHLEGRDGEVAISSDSGGSGAAGTIDLTTPGDLVMLDGGYISSDTYASGSAGAVRIKAGNLYMAGGDGTIAAISSDTAGGSGDAGAIELQVEGETVLDWGAYISSDTYGAGEAGAIGITTGSLRLEGDAGISTESFASATGNAGMISIDASEGVSLISGGVISTSTSTPGDAGALMVRAGTLLIDGGEEYWVTGLGSVAVGDDKVTAGSVGSIYVQAGRVIIKRGGAISIASIGPTRPGDEQQFVVIEAGKVALDDGASITAAAQGETPSATIEIYTGDKTLVTGDSAITTASEDADGGGIAIGGGLLYLEESQITTSVSGANGNGGDILLETDGLALNRGFIQANTAATGASGGNILIASPYLVIPATQGLVTGGSERLEFDPEGELSVIQAAAPDGVNGKIELEVPDLGLSAAIVAVDARYVRQQEIGSDPCAVRRGETPSSLTLQALGGGSRPNGTQLLEPCGSRQPE